MNKMKLMSYLLFSFSILLLIIMSANIIQTRLYYNQHPYNNSAPFYVTFLVNGVMYGVPAIVALALAFLFLKKASKQ